jgi:hypothetical protein
MVLQYIQEEVIKVLTITGLGQFNILLPVKLIFKDRVLNLHKRNIHNLNILQIKI